jgi:hypothetical protein
MMKLAVTVALLATIMTMIASRADLSPQRFQDRKRIRVQVKRTPLPPHTSRLSPPIRLLSPPCLGVLNPPLRPAGARRLTLLPGHSHQATCNSRSKQVPMPIQAAVRSQTQLQL